MADDPNRAGSRPPALMTTDQACKYLAMARSSLYKLARQQGVRRVKLLRCARWKVSDLDKLIDRGGRGRQG